VARACRYIDMATLTAHTLIRCPMCREDFAAEDGYRISIERHEAEGSAVFTISDAEAGAHVFHRCVMP
jgi:hypothetical protein